MACNNPLYRLPTIKEAVPARFQHRVKHGAIIMNRDDRDYLINVCHKKEDLFEQIPCGQCSKCRLEYSRQWAIRCTLESSYYKNCWFVTVTYDDNHLPKGLVYDCDSAEIEVNERGEVLHVLEPQDATNFLKRLRITADRQGLREDDKNDIRYFYCGEYGEKFKRPHFHFLFFGLDIPDLEVAYLRREHRFFYSDWLEKIWGKGLVVIGELCFDSCAYVARYVMKKQKGKGRKELLENKRKITFGDNCTTFEEFRDEFCRMSRRPGIAKRYFDEHKHDMYETDSLYVKSNKGLLKVKPCRYYDSLYDIENPEKLLSVKRNRKACGKANELSRRKRSSLSDVEYRLQNELATQEKIKKLKREVE